MTQLLRTCLPGGGVLYFTTLAEHATKEGIGSTVDDLPVDLSDLSDLSMICQMYETLPPLTADCDRANVPAVPQGSTSGGVGTSGVKVEVSYVGQTSPSIPSS